MKILGIDPGTRITGYGIIKVHPHKYETLDFGCIRPPVSAISSKKYLIIFEGIKALIDQYKPDALSVEGQFFHKNAMSALKLGMARGMAILAAELAGIPIFEYAPTKAKKAVVGHGGAREATGSAGRFGRSLR